MSIEWASGTRGDSYPELSRGTTQSGVRLYNERLILSLVRLHGQLPKAEMARLSDGLYDCSDWYDGLYQCRGKVRGKSIWVPRTRKDKIR